MQDSAYSALFGALSNEHRLDVIANNLANANTTGYKRDQLAFEDVFVEFAHDIIREPVTNLRADPLFPPAINMSKTRLAGTRIDLSQGSMKNTGGPLDFAIAGDGFFRIRTAQGDFLSRNGHFQVTADGNLVTEQGYAVLGGAGEIALPPGSKVVVNDAGEIFADGELVDAFNLVTVDEPRALEKLGSNLFRIADGAEAGEIPAENAVVNQGFLETANVNVVEEMVGMIETHRAFEAYQKMIRETNEMDTKAITKVGMYR